jgi:cytochrome c peroxidase
MDRMGISAALERAGRESRMRGKGNFDDSRLDDAAQFPIAAANHFGHVHNSPDRITSNLPALHLYQLSIRAPAPPSNSFDHTAADRGRELFSGKARCTTCHADPVFTEPGWNMHKASEVCVDDFQANRAPDHAYRTAPLNGLWTHTKGGYYHDGRFATLAQVVNHYDTCFSLGLTAQEQSDVVEYMKSLPRRR